MCNIKKVNNNLEMGGRLQGLSCFFNVIRKDTFHDVSSTVFLCDYFNFL